MAKTKNPTLFESYTAQDIEVLEGLEPVRRRPGMYIGGTDERALHHLAAEILDNAMDEAVAGYATRIEFEMGLEGTVTIRDNGRGIPVDKHPRYPKKSALEIIFTTLHSGGKFSGKAYQTSGGLHGVGSSVVNALSDQLIVESVREQRVWRQTYSRGTPTSPLQNVGPAGARKGTTVTFHPDPDIFGKDEHFKPERLYKMARSKAYLFRGVEIVWSCPAELLKGHTASSVPPQETLHFPRGLLDYLAAVLADRPTLTPQAFEGLVEFPDKAGRAEWAIAWPEEDEEGFMHSYCNTIPTPQGGTHEAGLRSAILKGLKSFGELTNNKRTGLITADDAVGGAMVLLSVFIRDPQFQGQTKEKLSTPETTRLVEQAVKDRFEHWLSSNPQASNVLLENMIQKAEERARRKQAKELGRKSATRKLRLPGKLTDCSSSSPENTEIFIVEGDSAGGSAKQARNRETQAILPLRGKILNVASATPEKMRANQELADLIQALGCGVGEIFSLEKLRYERVIIMTDADVDGAHIASLLMTFFYREMPGLIRGGKLYLAMPPLYRISTGNMAEYARDEAHRDQLLKTTFKNRNVEISRFKGLGEMPAAQLRDTTMSPSKRTLIRVTLPNSADPTETESDAETRNLVESLMGKKPELRFQYIQQNARFVRDVDV